MNLLHGENFKWHLLQRGYYSPPLARFIVKKNQGTDGFRKLIVFGGTEYKFSLYCSTAGVAKVGVVIQENSTVKEKLLSFPVPGVTGTVASSRPHP